MSLAVLSAVVLLSMWSNAIAAMFCPHMSGRSDCCLMQKASHDSPEDMSDLQMNHTHMYQAQMSDTDMPEMEMDSMDMPGMQMSGVAVSTKSGAIAMTDVPMQVAPQINEIDEAVTQPTEPCSHCMMHSRIRVTSTLCVVIQRNNAHQVIAANSSSETIKTIPSVLSLIDLHDHSPPGGSTSRHALISVFRI